MRLAGLLGLTGCLIGGGLSFGSQLPVRVYSTADGLKNNSVNRIVQDSRGFLWFCTSEGVSRFDGYGFVNYGVAEGLSHRRVNDVLESRSGEIWIATGGGLSKLGTGPTVEVVRDERVPAGARWISRLLEDRSSAPGQPALWCGTSSGLYRFTSSDGRFQRVDLGQSDADRNMFVLDLYEDRAHALWIGTDRGLFRYRAGEKLLRYTVPQNGVSSIRQDRSGAIWAGTWQGVVRIAGGRIDRVIDRRSGLAADYVSSLLCLENGSLWAGGTAGLTLLESGQVRQRIGAADGLVVDGIEALTEDREGNIWVGTDGGGAVKIATGGFTTYSQAEGLAGRPSTILESQAGELVVVAKTEDDVRLNLWRGNGFKPFQPAFPSPGAGWGMGQTAFQARNKEWWIAKANGLFRFLAVGSVSGLHRKAPVAAYGVSSRAPGPYKAFEDSRGDVWIAFRRSGNLALARWSRRSDSIENVAPAEGRTESFPFVFAEDPAGAVWIGYFQGSLMRYRGGQLRQVDCPPPADRGIRSLLVDSKGRLWVGTAEAGLLRFDRPGDERPQAQRYTSKDGLSGEYVECLTEDRLGRIYACTGRGIDRLDLASGRFRHYTTADGLVKGDVQMALRDREGALWFGSTQGVSRLIPKADRPAMTPYVQISRLEIAGVARGISPLGERRLAGLRVPYGAGPLRVEVTGIAFEPGEVLLYQTKLESVDRDWSAPSRERNLNYAALRPGSYRFLARAVNAEGLASAEPAEVDFTVLAPFWQRPWFLLACSMALAGMGLAAHRVRVARLVEIERVRNRIAADLHDDIGSSLSQISILSEVIRREPVAATAQAPIDRIAALSRELLDSMSDIVWAINPARDHCEDLIQRMRHAAAELFTAADLPMEFSVEADGGTSPLRPDLRRELLMVFKESANNVVKHARATRVAVRVRAGHGRFGFEMADDGCGFKRAALPEEGNGLRSMERRIRGLGGVVEIVSRPGAGTTVRIDVPVRGSLFPYLNR